MSDKTEQMIKQAFMIAGTLFFVLMSISVLRIGSAIAAWGDAMSSFPDFP